METRSDGERVRAGERRCMRACECAERRTSERQREACEGRGNNVRASNGEIVYERWKSENKSEKSERRTR